MKLLSLIALTLSLMMIFSVSTGLTENVPAVTEYENAFTQWREDAPALNALLEYVEAVTDDSSPDYIPEADSIAVFDMDGTLCAELYPTYLEYWLLERPFKPPLEVVVCDFFMGIDQFGLIPADDPRSGEDIAMLVYTSGSTGNPKEGNR